MLAPILDNPTGLHPREMELVARALLADPTLIAKAMAEKRWPDVLCLALLLDQGLPPALAATDPALYRTLSRQIAEVVILGFGSLNVARLRSLCRPISQ